MSQHDYNVANADGATFRADLNAMSQAIAELNGGSTAPSTTFAHMLWYDETNDQLMQRNPANTGWAQIGPTGFVEVAAATISGSPSSLDFTGWDSLYSEVIVTGWLLPATDDVNLYLRTAGTDDVLDVGASDYWWANRRSGTDETGSNKTGSTGDEADDEIELTKTYSHSTHGNVGVFNGDGGGVEFHLHFFVPNEAKYQRLYYNVTEGITDGGVTPVLVGIQDCRGPAMRVSAEKLGGISLFFDSGNISAGNVRVFARLA